jgi:hypothetical protein
MPVDWAPNPLITHSGSNTMNLAQIWLDPERDLAMVLMTNIGGSKAAEAFKALAPELYRMRSTKQSMRGTDREIGVPGYLAVPRIAARNHNTGLGWPALSSHNLIRNHRLDVD